MAGRKDIEAGAAYVRLYVERSDLVRGLRGAANYLQSFGATVAKIGGAVAGLGTAVMAPLTAMAYGFAQTGGNQLADRLATALKTVKVQLRELSDAIGAALAPSLIRSQELYSRVIKGVISWVKANQPLIATIATIATLVVGVGTAIMGLGAAISVIGTAVGYLATALSGIASVVGFLLTPWGALIAIVGAATAAFLTLTDTGRMFSEALVADMGDAYKIVWDMVGGIADALSAGDIELAAQIGLKGLKLAFLESTKSITEKWIDFNKGLVDIYHDAALDIMDIWRDTSQHLSEWFAELGFWMSGETNYMTDEEKKSSRDSALNHQYNQWQSRAWSGIHAAGDELQRALGDIKTKVGETVNRERKEFGELRTRAAKKKSEFVPWEPPKKETPGGSVVTFSAAALTALGQGGGPMEKLVKVNEEHKKLTARQLKLQEESNRRIKFIADLALLK